MKYVKEFQGEMRKVVSELEGKDMKRKRFEEIKQEIEPILNNIEKNIPILVELIRQRRIVLHAKADQIYILMTTLIDRCSRLPRSFGPGFWEHIWKLGVCSPKKQLCKLIRTAINNHKFNHEEFEEQLNKLIQKTNIIGDMLEKAERKYLQYTGRRQPGWPVIGRSFRENIIEELEFYNMKEVLRPCQLLTNQWLALCKKKGDGVI